MHICLVLFGALSTACAVLYHFVIRNHTRDTFIDP